MGCVYIDRRSGTPVRCIRYADVDGRIRKERTKAGSMLLARRILAERENAVEQARLMRLSSVGELINPKPPTSVRQFSKGFKEHVEAYCSSETVRRYKCALDSNILPVLGDHEIRMVNPGHIQKYADGRLSEGSRPATVRQEMMILSGLFREAMKQELIERNPVHLTKKPRVDNVIVRYLNHSEEENVLAFVEEPLRSAILVAIHSGLREGEQLNLTWADVHFDVGHIVVRNTKSKRDRVVPMSATLRQVLKGVSRVLVKGEPSPFVFTNTATGTKFQRFNADGWRAALRKAGVENFRWHDLRHTFGSRLAQAGVPITVIKELMGHSTVTVTMRYAHLTQGNLQQAVKVLDAGQFLPESAHGGAQEPAQQALATG